MRVSLSPEFRVVRLFGLGLGEHEMVERVPKAHVEGSPYNLLLASGMCGRGLGVT